MKRAEKKYHLVEVATNLFNKHGYNGVGIDRIIAESGIAKTTLYRHFKTKEDLIVAVLAKKDAEFRAALRQFVEAGGADPTQRLLLTFDFLEHWINDDEFYGCPFMSASSEFNDKRSPVFQEARMHKKLVLAYFEELARAAEHPEPERLAIELNLLQEGAVAVAQITGDPTIARHARSTAQHWINRHIAAERA